MTLLYGFLAEIEVGKGGGRDWSVTLGARGREGDPGSPRKAVRSIPG